MLRQHTVTFLKQEKSLVPADLQTLPIGFEEDFAELISKATSGTESCIGCIKDGCSSFYSQYLGSKVAVATDSAR